jgi:hypothetical protein
VSQSVLRRLYNLVLRKDDVVWACIGGLFCILYYYFLAYILIVEIVPNINRGNSCCCYYYFYMSAFVSTSTLCGIQNKKRSFHPHKHIYMTTSPLLTEDNNSRRISTKPRSKATPQPKQMCVKCGKTMPAIGTARLRGKRTHGDWKSRTLHKKCWRELYGRWWRRTRIIPPGIIVLVPLFFFHSKKKQPTHYQKSAVGA